MLSEEAMPILMGTFDSNPCPRHKMKQIEYFSKTCSESVCVKCIYDEHNVIADQAKNLKLILERKKDEHDNLMNALRKM